MLEVLISWKKSIKDNKVQKYDDLHILHKIVNTPSEAVGS